MSGLLGAPAVAYGFPLPALRIGEGVAGARSMAVRRVWMPDFGDRRDDFPGYTHAIASLVSRHVVGDHAEERRQRVGAAASAGAEEL